MLSALDKDYKTMRTPHLNRITLTTLCIFTSIYDSSQIMKKTCLFFLAFYLLSIPTSYAGNSFKGLKKLLEEDYLRTRRCGVTEYPGRTASVQEQRMREQQQREQEARARRAQQEQEEKVRVAQEKARREEEARALRASEIARQAQQIAAANEARRFKEVLEAKQVKERDLTTAKKIAKIAHSSVMENQLDLPELEIKIDTQLQTIPESHHYLVLYEAMKRFFRKSRLFSNLPSSFFTSKEDFDKEEFVRKLEISSSQMIELLLNKFVNAIQPKDSKPHLDPENIGKKVYALYKLLMDQSPAYHDAAFDILENVPANTEKYKRAQIKLANYDFASNPEFIVNPAVDTFEIQQTKRRAKFLAVIARLDRVGNRITSRDLDFKRQVISWYAQSLTHQNDKLVSRQEELPFLFEKYIHLPADSLVKELEKKDGV